MGIIKVAIDAIKGNLGDQWLEVFEADNMGGETVFTKGVPVRTSNNTKGTSNSISNGSIIHVYPDQFMFIIDGGKIVDYTAEQGYYKVENSSMPSLFNGQFGSTLKEAFSRVKYGGTPPTAQKVYYINTQEIKGQKFGTPNAVNYFDTFYNAELFLRAHGDYSIKITNPILFYTEVIPKNADKIDFPDISEQYLAEFLEAFQAALNQMSADGQRISFVTSKQGQISKYMESTLDDSWSQKRGFEIESVGINSISYDDESKTLISKRSQGAMLQGEILQGYTQSTLAEGVKAAGSNEKGAAMGMMGVGMGMGVAGQSFGHYQQMPQQTPQQAPPAYAAGAGVAAPLETPGSAGWTCSCGRVNTGNFCSNCGKAKPDDGKWTCSCGTVNTGNFCSNCGKPKA